MSTRATIAHGDNWHLFWEMAGDPIVACLEIDEPEDFEVSPDSVMVQLPEHLGKLLADMLKGKGTGDCNHCVTMADSPRRGDPMKGQAKKCATCGKDLTGRLGTVTDDDGFLYCSMACFQGAG